MMATNVVPGYAGGDAVSGERFTTQVAGTAQNSDPTNEPGQYPPGPWGNSIFGRPLPSGTRAGGTRGAQYRSATDPTNQPGQVSDGISGITPAERSNSGAPASQGAGATQGGPDPV